MFFVLISFALGSQREPSFQWDMGFSIIRNTFGEGCYKKYSLRPSVLTKSLEGEVRTEGCGEYSD